MMIYRIVNITDPNVYSEVIKYAIQNSTYFSVCTFRFHHQRDVSEQYHLFLTQLLPYEINVNVETPRPYTKGQQYHIFRMERGSADIIQSVPEIKCWKAPDYPEDITFYRNRKPWLYMITHECIAYLNATSTLKLDVGKMNHVKLLEVHDFDY